MQKLITKGTCIGKKSRKELFRNTTAPASQTLLSMYFSNNETQTNFSLQPKYGTALSVNARLLLIKISFCAPHRKGPTFNQPAINVHVRSTDFECWLVPVQRGRKNPMRGRGGPIWSGSPLSARAYFFQHEEPGRAYKTVTSAH